MTPESLRDHVAKPSVETVEKLSERDVHELSDAAESAIEAGGGFGWLTPPPKSVMEDYWRGVKMI
ncbi:MAG: GNAT family N-acetyltransferase, partial [Candidatus Puniceispirillum sp.]